MNRSFAVLLLGLIWALPLTAWSAVSEDVEAILNDGGDNTVERLVDYGAAGEADAAATMETVARRRPKLLPETVRGLFLRLDAEVFDAAVSLSLENLADDPSLQQLVLSAANQSRGMGARRGNGRRDCAGGICGPDQRVAPGNRVDNPSDPNGPPDDDDDDDGNPPIPPDPPASPS